MPVFDRRPSFDERSRSFPIRALIGDRYRRGYTWRVGVNLDQGEEGACVGFAWAHELAARPVVVPGIDYTSAKAIYYAARKVDEWEGEDYDGTSVLAGAKTCVTYKRLKEYRWAFGEDDLALAVGYKGPAVIGVNWYEGMMEPTWDAPVVRTVQWSEGPWLRPIGSVVGGHAICVNGYSAKLNAYRVHNSWGASWGQEGEALIHREDMAYLLEREGEACIPVVRTLGT